MKAPTFISIISLGVMFGTIGIAAHAGNMSAMEWGIDRPGSDYKSFITARNDPQLCQDQCAAEDQCRAWTFGPNTSKCWLKNAVPNATLHTNAVSGVKTRP